MESGKKKRPVVIWPQDLDVKYVGKFPYRWKLTNALKDVWNPNEPRLFPPKQFGIGWGINLHVLWNAYRKIKDRLPPR